MVVEECLCRHDEAGRAVAALLGVVVNERLLHRVELVAFGAMPSMVWILLPSASMASIVQA